MATDQRVRILTSFHYYRNTDLDKLFGEWDPAPDIFADSGAFSAKSQGATISVEDYAAWVKRWSHWLTIYANLDVIGDNAASAAATAANQKALEDLGLDPVPVWHIAEPHDAFLAILERYRYIAIGGLVGRPVPTTMSHLVRVHQAARGIAGLHGFGMTSWQPLADLPWYSVDSSSWGSGYRYGTVAVFDPATGRWRSGRLYDHASIYQIAPLIRALGFDPKDFVERDRYHHYTLARMSAATWRSVEEWHRKRHGLQHLPDDDRPPGLNLYLAGGNKDYLVGTHFEDTPIGLRLFLADGAPANHAEAAKGVANYLAKRPDHSPEER